ncbi:MAG: cytochrome BD oxidase subunit I [Gammaproteobacteria bacterium RIFCSPHIGHO2_12_FULL_41_20]|nr:MAG: cytochrome BD oxidase subunit I [Gammaproteobacteria bacterium RIFCSPHIGHO2_12_FULL_41_20]
MLIEVLSRIQFAFTVSFHILFPSFSIGLVTFIAIFEGIWLKTRNPHYLHICKFWTKVLALTFGMGVVSGIVMEFQFGTNWSKFAYMVGDVLGVLFTYEVLTAFFIEAGFLGVMFFGWNRVGPRLHYLATLLVLFGVTFSAFWILSANSWMQTPAGVVLDGDKFAVTSWWNVIFNPLLWPRYLHMLLAAYISTSLVIAAISAYYLLKQQHLEFARTCFSFVMWALLVLLPIQIFLGDSAGLNVHQYQPIKTAAMEGVWETQYGAPLLLFALPDQAAEKNYFELKIPKLASLLNTHELNGELVGLKSVPAVDRPPVFVVFWSFRVMVGLAGIIFLLAITGCILRYAKKLYDYPIFLKFCILSAPLGFICVITGWFTAEFGRQPWVVYHYLRTMDAHSPINLHHVLISLAMIIVVYGIIFGVFYFKYFFRIVQAGPIASEKTVDRTFAYMSPSAIKK